MAVPKISNLSLGIIILADLAATSSNIAIPILGEVGIAAATGAAVFLVELLTHKQGFVGSAAWGVLAAFSIAIPGPVGAIGAGAYLMFGKKVG